MRLDLMFRGAATAVAAPILLILWFTRSDHEKSGQPDLATAPSSLSALVLSESPLLRAMDARELGLRLLTLSDPNEVRAGLSSLTKAAEQGDAEAQVALGKIYLQGIVAVPKDAGRAHAWFVRAASAHHPSADYFLGVMSQSGEGVAADPAAAARWFETAAQEGSPHAMFLLANAYRAGAGVPRDDGKALDLYAKAGELEHPAALQALAMAYQRGELGLEPDDAESRRYAMEAEHAIKHAPTPP
jgi:uncharacterized protein